LGFATPSGVISTATAFSFESAHCQLDKGNHRIYAIRIQAENRIYAEDFLFAFCSH
jgi:hypothetical protein